MTVIICSNTFPDFFAVWGSPAPSSRPTVLAPASVRPYMKQLTKLKTFNIPLCAASSVLWSPKVPTSKVMNTN